MPDPSTVKIFFVDGEPDSIRTAEISNWTGKAVAGPRSRLNSLLTRPEADKPGVYFLMGVNPESGYNRVYVGQAESIQTRIKGHIDRDFWTNLLFFESKDGNLTRAHVQYLEGQLIDMIKRADRYELENSQASRSHLPESDRADMNVFLQRVELLLSSLGLNFLKPVPDSRGTSQLAGQLECSIKNVRAVGRRTDEGFLVLKGSEAVLQERPSSKKYPSPSNMRSDLLSSGVLVARDDRLVFARDHQFSSPSAAASVIHGGHANGLTAWKDKAGRTLKQVEEDALATAEA